MIVNLTQHPATPEQRAQGVADLPAGDLPALKSLLTFDDLPNAAEINERAAAIASMAASLSAPAAMVGGAGYLMPALERALIACGIEPLHAFTRREVIETIGTDGSVTKTAVFRHAGWVRT